MSSNSDKNKIIAVLGTAAVILIAVIVIGFVTGGKSKKEKGTVVCSFYPVYVLADNLLQGTGHKAVNMTENLTGCIHDYQMTTRDMRTLEEAELLLVNGGGMESFLDKVEQNYPTLPIISIAGIHNDVENPHIWMSPDLEMDCVDYLNAELCKVFPNDAELIRKNADDYINRIFEGPYKKKLDIIERLETKDHRIGCICFNEAFEVLSDALGFVNIAVFSLDENETPSAGEISEAIEKAKKFEEVVVLIEEELAINADKVVRETGAAVIYIDPLTSGNGADSYINGMNADLDGIAKYLDR